MPRQNFIGLVVSQGKMNKTVKVRIQTSVYDKLVHKEVLKRKDYLVHDEGNLCREGDIVRIEQIPKMSARKFYSVAEIKSSKGHQFELYEKLAKNKVAEDEKASIAEFFAKKDALSKTITHLDDLRKLDGLAIQFQSGQAASSEERDFLLKEISKIKEKYGIRSWPSTQPVVTLKMQENEKDLSAQENRLKNIQHILQRLLKEDQYASVVEKALSDSKKPIAELSPRIKKNMLRKWVLNVDNELPSDILETV